MQAERVLRRFGGLLPVGLRSIAKRMFYRDRHWAHPALKRFGTVQDLYYWTADGALDTVLLLQNYFSALYPDVDTETAGSVTLFDAQGNGLTKRSFKLPHNGTAKLRVSSILRDAQVSEAGSFGTLVVHIAIPRAVLALVQDQRSVYYWDRYYIGYSNEQGQVCFVHGVDKTDIFQDGNGTPSSWYGSGGNHEWAPEIPVNIEEYARFSVIMINRSSSTRPVTLVLSDIDDKSLSWTADIPPRGAHRFQLTAEDLVGLSPTELRMRIRGMPTQYGRPVVFKEFRNGAISAMHC